MPTYDQDSVVLKTILAGSTVLHRRGTQHARDLVIINKGPGAITFRREASAWDLMEIYFAKKDQEAIAADPLKSDADWIIYEHDRNMRKFAIIKRIFEAFPELFDYESVMMLDDDLVPVGCKVADIFTLFRETGCRIGQPALSKDSYWSHDIVIQNAGFRWRRTNFVEVMCPIMTVAAMRMYLPLFNETISAFGLDYYWSTQEWHHYGGLAVLDATPMRHSRPVGGGMAYQGLSPDEDWVMFFRKHKLKNFRHRTLDGVPIHDWIVPSVLPIRYWIQISDLVKFKVRLIQRRVLLFILLTNFLLSLFMTNPPVRIFTLKKSEDADGTYKGKPQQ